MIRLLWMECRGSVPALLNEQHGDFIHRGNAINLSSRKHLWQFKFTCLKARPIVVIRCWQG